MLTVRERERGNQRKRERGSALLMKERKKEGRKEQVCFELSLF